MWKCSCGAVNTGNFCTVCGLAKAVPAAAPAAAPAVAPEPEPAAAPVEPEPVPVAEPVAAEPEPAPAVEAEATKERWYLQGDWLRVGVTAIALGAVIMYNTWDIPELWGLFGLAVLNGILGNFAINKNGDTTLGTVTFFKVVNTKATGYQKFISLVTPSVALTK